MARSLADSLRWMQQGAELFTDAARARTRVLPEWSEPAAARLDPKHVIAHVAANADALPNLAHWAATGQPTPMYASAHDRAAGIGRGSRLSPRVLKWWLVDADQALTREFACAAGGRHRATPRASLPRSPPRGPGSSSPGRRRSRPGPRRRT